MICLECGIENIGGAHYCKQCGTALQSELVQQGLVDLEGLKDVYASSESKIKSIEKDINQLKKFLHNVNRLKQEYKEVRKISREVNKARYIEQRFKDEVLRIRKEIESQIRDARYYKIGEVGAVKDNLESVSSRITLLEKSEASTIDDLKQLQKNFDTKIGSFEIRMEKSVKKLEELGTLNQQVHKLEEFQGHFDNKIRSDVRRFEEKLEDKMDSELGQHLKDYVSNLEKEFSSRFNVLQQDISTQLHELMSEYGKIKRNYSKISKVEENSKHLAELRGQVYDIYKSNNGFEDKIKDLKEDIEKISYQVGNIGSLDTLRHDLEDMKKKGDTQISSVIHGLEDRFNNRLKGLTDEFEDRAEKVYSQKLAAFESSVRDIAQTESSDIEAVRRRVGALEEGRKEIGGAQEEALQTFQHYLRAMNDRLVMLEKMWQQHASIAPVVIE